jgi:hypothetical protein
MEQCATLYEKIQLQKYFYIRQFNDAGKEQACLSEFWDDNYLGFFRRLKYTLTDNQCIFNKIARRHNQENIFAIDIEHIKLVDTEIDQIFDEFTFKDIRKSSGHKSILKAIYNTYFQKMILNTKQDKQRNCVFEMLEQPMEVYDFAKQYLILDNEVGATYQDLARKEDAVSCIEI